MFFACLALMRGFIRKEHTMNAKKELFTKIASQHLNFETLESRNRDSLDFHDVSVRGVAAALDAAYEAGKEAAQTNLIDAIKDNISPAAAALLIAKLQLTYTRGETGRQAQREHTWLAEQLAKELGRENLDSLYEELGI